MLEVSDLAVGYGKHRALGGVSLSVRPGEIVVILGANGAGKSTLLKAIAGICEGHSSGAVSMGGEPLLGLPAHKVVEQGIALVPEGRGVFGELTVKENLMLGANPARARDEAEGNYDRLIRLFPKLADRAGQTVSTMSGGEQQMVAIGRAMMSNPTILMLDEPSLGLSPLLSKDLFQSLKAVRAAGLGILLVEQNAKLSLGIADRGYLLENGQIAREDRADILKNDPAVQAAYLGGAAGHRSAAPAPMRKPMAAMDAPPKPFAVRPQPSMALSASQISGVDIDAVVAAAGRQAVESNTSARPTLSRPMATLPPALAATQDAALAQMMTSMEQAARCAMEGRREASTLPPLRPTARPATPQPTAAAPVMPAPSQPMGQPSGGPITHYTRRPGASQFDRRDI
ncbi:ABC transporter ATP-binding protein [Roseicyclus sp.]|uniref:ABC transporter ATP-binding protein n=1 Tax=Roseicyclus sp. TaxID=1914329 RepID=UPI001BCAD7A5|nr:ATP-binding cassette domain-containing protein [Roseicyclus sp.]